MKKRTPKKTAQPWLRRLYLPCYQIKEAAIYAGITSKTVASWHHDVSIFPKRESRTELSYMQLIEVAVVAAFRKAGLQLKIIRKAREYISKILLCEYPFAVYQFKTDGKELLMNYEQIEGKKGKDKLISLNRHGQLGWKEIIDPLLSEFEYENLSAGNLAFRWHIGKKNNSSVIIDPQISYGAPSVSGTPTWIIRGRWEAGESLSDIACDFHLEDKLVKEALHFEGITPNIHRQSLLTCH